MARKMKQNMKDGVDRRKTGYFATPSFVAEFIGKELLRYNPNGKKVLDPALGKEELLSVFTDEGIECIGYDIHKFKDNYGCNFIQADFIKTFISCKRTLKNEGYDYIVLNPPYICHECDYIVGNKESLKDAFEVGPFNMSALFLSGVIDIAKEGCLIGSIMPDGILFEKSYEKLRQKILNDCTILEVLLCPEDLFHSQLANVSCCILLMRKGRPHENTNTVLIVDRPRSSAEFQTILSDRKMELARYEDILYKHNGKTIFILGEAAMKVARLLSGYPSLGYVYECGGGVSTGNNGTFASKELKGGFSVPFITNPASSRFTVVPTMYLCDDFVEKSKEHRNFIIRNKECLKKEGIACASIGRHFGAVYLPSNFITGLCCTVWPPEEDILWLLAYLNSSLVTYYLKGVVDRGNMTTIGSIKSLPVIDFSAIERQELEGISKAAMNDDLTAIEAVAMIDRIVFQNTKIDETLQAEILRFCSDLTHNV